MLKFGMNFSSVTSITYLFTSSSRKLQSFQITSYIFDDQSIHSAINTTLFKLFCFMTNKTITVLPCVCLLSVNEENDDVDDPLSESKKCNFVQKHIYVALTNIRDLVYK